MKNTLVRYKGGGYDGCFWEWNYAYFDSDGKFHDIYSSGRQGLPEEHQVRALIESQPNGTDPELFDLGKPKDLESLNEINASSIVQIARWLEENLGYELLIQCDDCKNSVDVLDIRLTDLQKDGGIVYSHHGKVCEGCYCGKLCAGCDEYTPGELAYIEDEGQYCEWCHDEKMAEISEIA